MSDIRMVDMPLLDELFEMQSGYVLDFTDRTMSLFFAEMNVDIGAREYCRDGMSKAKRLRCFLRTVDNKSAAATLKSLWEYRTEYRLRTQQPESVHNARGRFLSLISRLEGGAHPGVVGSAPAPAFDGVRLRQLSKQFLDLAALAPQQRGYRFETFLGALFGAYGLKPREPFRLRGEQIDGSFQLQGETYLLEAKWESKPTGAADLFVFEGKLSEKALWTRGLFVSYTGFTEAGLEAFGRAKRLVCMDGLDLHETLSRELPLDKVIAEKVRRAAETGSPFHRVRDLYPSI